MTNFISLINYNGGIASYHVQSVSASNYIARLVRSADRNLPQVINIQKGTALEDRLQNKLIAAIESIEGAENSISEKEVN
jgi:hypothetical protein